METKTLAELVREAQKGDKQAQQELYLDSSKSVFFLALKILRNKDDAEDITQDTFITVFEKLPELKNPAAYYKWINQITANKCTDLLRRNKPLPIDEPDFLDALGMEDEDATPAPDKLYDDEETRRLILEIIDALPDTQRVCVMYRYFNQLSIEEISDITGANEHTVKSRLALARQKIRAAILEKEEREGIRLHVLIPIMPILMKALEDFQMPEGLTARMWEKIAEDAGIAAGTAAASEVAQAGAKEAAKQGVKAKVIGGAAGAVVVAGIITALLWSKAEPPAPIIPPPSSTPVISQPAPSTPEPSPTDEPIDFQEPAIETAIKAALQEIDTSYDGGDITPQMMDGFTQIRIDAYPAIGIEDGFCSIAIGDVQTIAEMGEELDIADLKYMTRLSNIDIRCEKTVLGMEILSEMEFLRSVYIRGCPNVNELPNMSNAQSLTTVALVDMNLVSLHGLESAMQLSLQRCDISDLSDISNATQLNSLEINGCTITDISPVGAVTTLNLLSIIDTPVSDISPLAPLTELTGLSLINTGVSDISAIAGMTKLKVLSLWNNNISDVSPLAGLTQLESLGLQGNPIADRSLLDGLTDTEIIFED